jgi:hypothetical protein
MVTFTRKVMRHDEYDVTMYERMKQITIIYRLILKSHVILYVF